MDLPYQEPGQILDALGESMAMQGGFGIPPMNYGHSGLVPQGGPGSTSALPDSKAGDTGKLSKTMVLSLIEGLNRRVAELENLDGVRQQQVAQMIAHQSHRCEAGNQQMCEHFEKRLRDLDGSVQHHISVAVKSFERAPAMRDVDDADEESSDDSEGEVDRVGASLEAYSDRALLAVVRHGFAHYMGIPNLQVKHLPVSWPKDDEAWPTDSVTSTKLVRFRWEESHTHSDNHEGLCKIWTYIREKGALFSPSAEKALKVISEEHLRERVIEKYHSLQKALRSAGHIPSTRVSAVATASAQRLGEPGDPPPLTKGVRQSRQLGKLEVRERKFKALPDDSKYKTDAYKTALVQQLMSEDEDERDAEGKLTGCFLTRPWMWASDERNTFIAEVDAQQDPELPKRYTKRVRGPLGKVGLPRIQKVESRARRWMVSPQWLMDPMNQQFDVPAFVVDNGKAWGEPKDPEETVTEKKRVKNEKREYAAKKKIKLDEKVSKKGKAKGKGKMKAKAVEEAQPVASSSKVVAEKDGNESSDFE